MGLRAWLRKTLYGRGAPTLALRWTKAMWAADLWQGNRWLGVEICQWPTDLLIMQEIVFEQRPKVIIETGTYRGGSSIFYASLLKLLDGGRVISVDIEHSEEVRRTVAGHPLGSSVTLVTGDSKAPEIVGRGREELAGEERVLVVLDSAHSRAHVLDELRTYRQFVPVGGYLAVFDTICRELRSLPGLGAWRQDNPLNAVEEFLAEAPEFEADRSREKLLVSFCPGGFLRRVR